MILTAEQIRNLVRQLSEDLHSIQLELIEEKIADNIRHADDATVGEILTHPRVTLRRLYDVALREAVARLLAR